MKSQKAVTTTDRQKRTCMLLVDKNDHVKNKIFLVGFLPECRFKFAGSSGQDESALDDK